MKRSPLALLPLAAPASAAPVTILEVEVPKLDVAEYHRPYLAAWVEDGDNRWVANLSVNYDTGLRNEEGEDWLKDLRQWWRRSGRELDLPIDGLSRPTLPPGEHEIEVTALIEQLPQAGDYQLVVEAARENGGREVVKVPFHWDGTAVAAVTGHGQSELGAIAFGSADAAAAGSEAAAEAAPGESAEAPAQS